jgi:hypothetical protein
MYEIITTSAPSMYASQGRGFLCLSAVLLPPRQAFDFSAFDLPLLGPTSTLRRLASKRNSEVMFGVEEQCPARRRRHEKRVHLSNVVFEVTIPPVEENEKPLLWWERYDFDCRRASDQSLVEENSPGKNPDYHDAIRSLRESYLQGQSRRVLLAHVQSILKVDSRGLEQRIAPLLKAHRQTHIKQVLKMQKKLQTEGTHWSVREALLRKKSQKMSRAGRQLAFRLAQADDLEVKQMNGLV